MAVEVILPFCTRVIFVKNEKDFNKVCKLENIKDIQWDHSPGSTWRLYRPPSHLAIVAIQVTDNKYLPSVLAHEVTHVLNGMFEFIGEDKPGDEIRAYLTQYLVQEGMEFYLDKKAR